uniref:Uncharacterized protein n=1 Tax=Sipha flava TaxID=143950 RepID=A0A2S2QSS5_9HEMI
MHCNASECAVSKILSNMIINSFSFFRKMSVIVLAFFCKHRQLFYIIVNKKKQWMLWPPTFWGLGQNIPNAPIYSTALTVIRETGTDTCSVCMAVLCYLKIILLLFSFF